MNHPPSVYLLIPLSGGCRVWVDENVEAKDWQRMAGGVAVSHRYIDDITDGLQEAGFLVNLDFEVTA